MTSNQIKKELTDKLASVFSEVFIYTDFMANEDANALDINEWDSLRHMILISKIESAFNIKFEAMDVLEAKSLKGIKNIIRRKLQLPYEDFDVLNPSQQK